MSQIGSTPGGLDLSNMFNDGSKAVADKGKALETKMNEIMGQDTVDQQDLITLQFEMGQYNAMLETLSSVTKSMTDMLKSLAQRTG